MRKELELSVIGSAGFYNYNQTMKDMKKDYEDNPSEYEKEYKEALKLKDPLNLPPGKYELDVNASSGYSVTVKVTKKTSTHDILMMIKKGIGWGENYYDSIIVDTDKKVIEASLGT